MSEEEKKIKEMEELGIRLIDSPSETVAKASPTKLKLQALTFMVIGKIERYFLNNMLKQAKEARNLAEVGLRNVDMTLDDKMAFKKYLDSNITLLEEKMAIFDKNYKRVIGRGKRSLKLPSANFAILVANMAVKKRRQDTMVNMIDAYKQMNDVFSTAKTEFVGMPKPIKKDIEISKVEQEGIKKAVYQALSGTTDKEVEKFATESSDKSGAKFDTVIDEMASKIVSTKAKAKEKELDNFFENISPIKKKAKLDDSTLDQILNGGQVKDKNIFPKQKKTDNSDLILTSEKPVFTKDSTGTVNFAGKASLDNPKRIESYLYEYEGQENNDIFKGSSPLSSSSKENIGADTLSDEELEDFATRLTEKKVLTAHHEVKDASIKLNDIKAESLVPDIVDLRAKLDESINEIERKRQAKEEARKKYEAEKQAREQEENELSENKRLIEEMKKEIERKREEQKAIEELNQKVAKALKFQKQIEENRRAALEEEEEARKYQETLRIERENQTKVAKEKEKLQSERVVLQSETFKVDFNLQREKEKLEEAKRQLQMFNTHRNMQGIDPADINYDGLFASFTMQPTLNQKNSYATTPKSDGYEQPGKTK